MKRKTGTSLLELTIVMIVFTVVLSAVLLLYVDLSKRSQVALNNVEKYSELFKIDSIIQTELSKAGPNIGKITLIKESESSPARGLRYTVSIPFVTGKVTKQFYFNDEKLKIWEKVTQQVDFTDGDDSLEVIDSTLESGERVIFSTTPFDNVDVEFESAGGGSVFYKITLTTPGGVEIHRSSVKLINVK